MADVEQQQHEPLAQPLLPSSQRRRERQQRHTQGLAQPHAAASTFWPCVVNLTKAITGAGMAAIPRAYVQVGWLCGTLMLVGLAGVMWFSLGVLVRGACDTRTGSYGTLVQATCGAGLARVLQAAVLVFCFGFSVTYLVVIRDILLGTPGGECNGLLCEAFGPAAAAIDARLATIAVAAVLAVPLLLLRSLRKLAALNTAGVAATVALAGSAAALAAVAAGQGVAHPIPLLPQWQQLGPTRSEQLQALASVLPVMLACYVAHQSLFPAMQLLQPYTPASMNQVTAAALALSGAVFLALAVGAGLAFGPGTDVNVLENLSVAGLTPLLGPRTAAVLSWLLRVGYMLCIAATLLLYMHPLRASVAELLWPDAQPVSAPAAAAVAAAAGGGAGVAAVVDGAGEQQHQQQQVQQQQQQQHQCGSAGDASASMWQQLERANYVPLSCGLLAALVLTAVVVDNIFQTVSAVGDIAGTTQAFIVPGVVALSLLRQAKLRSRGPGGRMALAGAAQQDGSSASRQGHMHAAAAVLLVALGVLLFVNGVVERVLAVL